MTTELDKSIDRLGETIDASIAKFAARHERDQVTIKALTDALKSASPIVSQVEFFKDPMTMPVSCQIDAALKLAKGGR